MNKATVINIYNFVRRSHEEPGRFIPDDFDTIANQMMVLKQLGLPSTYALKHDALIDPAYQKLFLENTDEGDEIGAWWEITGELCRRAGVSFLGNRGEVHDDRVATAYCLGYTPEERMRLVDAYMKDFHDIFGYYPKTIGSWVMDVVTFRYAKEKYGVEGGALCRDQIGVDGFTLWGGYVNGIYYPSLKNEMVPAQTPEEQLDLPIFRLLGPDPIYNFEDGLQPGVSGVFSLEPSCVVGRDENWVSWMFGRLTEEDTIGVSYAQVGQENNFLWENIEPGFEMQLRKLKAMAEAGQLRIETMAETARWFRSKYRLTPPSTFQASEDWNERLKTHWYCSRFYRVSFLHEAKKLFIRDWFLFDEAYPSRYLTEPLREAGSCFDTLPLMDGHGWYQGERPKAELVDLSGEALYGEDISFHSSGDWESEICWQTNDGPVTVHLGEAKLEIHGAGLRFNCLPVLTTWDAAHLHFCHQGFAYQISLAEGRAETDALGRLCLLPEAGRLVICLGNPSQEDCYTSAYRDHPERIDSYRPKYLDIPKNSDRLYPAPMPKFPEGDRVCMVGTTYLCEMTGEGECYYTLDGSEPNEGSMRYTRPIALTGDTVVKARCYRDGFAPSRTAQCRVFFGVPVEAIESGTYFDPRRVFNRQGAFDLLDGLRGSLDYQDGRWLGTTDDIDVVLTLPETGTIGSIRMGFISQNRAGVIYPDYVEFYAGTEKDALSPIGRVDIPDGPGQRQIERRDVVLETRVTAKYLRVFAHNLRIQPDWACYHGLPGVFLMADSIVITR